MRWVRAVLGVDESLVVAACGLSQRVVRAGDFGVVPVSVRFAGCHVMDVGAVVEMVRFVRSDCFSTATGAIAFVLEATDGGAQVGKVRCVGEGGGRGVCQCGPGRFPLRRVVPRDRLHWREAGE